MLPLTPVDPLQVRRSGGYRRGEHSTYKGSLRQSAMQARLKTQQKAWLDAKQKVQSARCGVRSAGCRVRGPECKVQSASIECKIQTAEKSAEYIGVRRNEAPGKRIRSKNVLRIERARQAPAAGLFLSQCYGSFLFSLLSSSSLCYFYFYSFSNV